MVYEEIRRYFDDHKIKQTPIAHEAGMTRQALSQSLLGKRCLMVDEYFGICHALGVPVDTFEPGSSDENRPSVA